MRGRGGAQVNLLGVRPHTKDNVAYQWRLCCEYKIYGRQGPDILPATEAPYSGSNMASVGLHRCSHDGYPQQRQAPIYASIHSTSNNEHFWFSTIRHLQVNRESTPHWSTQETCIIHFFTIKEHTRDLCSDWISCRSTSSARTYHGIRVHRITDAARKGIIVLVTTCQSFYLSLS